MNENRNFDDLYSALVREILESEYTDEYSAKILFVATHELLIQFESLEGDK